MSIYIILRQLVDIYSRLYINIYSTLACVDALLEDAHGGDGSDVKSFVLSHILSNGLLGRSLMWQ